MSDNTPKFTFNKSFDNDLDMNVPSKDLNDSELIALMERRLNENLMILQDWREWEVRENYAMFEGNQWSIEDFERQQSNVMPTLTVNRVKPVFEAICGWEQQNRLDIKYNPRLMNQEQEGFSDLMNNVVAWIEQSTFADTQRSYAFKDMLICGVGATDTTINYDTGKGTGDVEYKRIFPAFLFWDASAREKNILDADWIVKLKVVNRDTIREEYGLDYYDDVYSAQLDARILEFFSSVLAVKQLGVIYEYQWRDKVSFYRVENPFKDLPTEGLVVNHDTGDSYDLTKLREIIAQKYGFSPDIPASQVSMDKKEFSELRSLLAPFGFKLKKTEQYKYCYYRALITGGQVISRAENYSQTGFSVKFMTDQFSEISQYYYGLGRGVKVPQRMLNQAVSDFQGFLATIPKGGVNIERDAVTDLGAFVDTWSRAKYVSVYEPGALSTGKVMPKAAPPLPQGLMEMIQYVDSQILAVCGVTPELMGTVNSKEMNSQFYAQQIRQGLTTLASLLDAKRMMMHEQGKLNVDVARILAENDEGRLIANVTGKGSAPYYQLLKNNIAEEYDIVISDVPESPGKKQETFGKLLELQGQLASLPNPINIMPIALEYSDLDEDVKKQMMEMMQPAPPAQPDPVNQALLQSQTALNMSNARKNEADAHEKMVNTEAKAQELGFIAPQKAADIQLTHAKADAEHSKIHHKGEEIAINKFAKLTNHFNTKEKNEQQRYIQNTRSFPRGNQQA